MKYALTILIAMDERVQSYLASRVDGGRVHAVLIWNLYSESTCRRIFKELILLMEKTLRTL